MHGSGRKYVVELIEAASKRPACGLRVGTDLVDVGQVIDSIERFGDRYLRRVYTDREVSTCIDPASGRPAPSRLAARFAAKEAMTKVLRPTLGAPYTDIEVVLGAAGEPNISLTGHMAERATEIGLVDYSLSLTHDGGYAMAFVVAMIDDSRPVDLASSQNIGERS